MPWIAQVDQKGPSCLSSGCWILLLFFLNIAFVESWIIERGVRKRIEYFKPISLLFTAFCILITVAQCGFCFVLKLKLFSAKSVQYNLMYSVQAKYYFFLIFFFFFSPLPFTSRSLPNLLQWLMGQWVPVCTITQGLCLNSSWKHLYQKWRKLISKLCLPWMTSGRWSKPKFFSPCFCDLLVLSWTINLIWRIFFLMWWELCMKSSLCSMSKLWNKVCL